MHARRFLRQARQGFGLGFAADRCHGNGTHRRAARRGAGGIRGSASQPTWVASMRFASQLTISASPALGFGLGSDHAQSSRTADPPSSPCARARSRPDTERAQVARPRDWVEHAWRRQSLPTAPGARPTSFAPSARRRCLIATQGQSRSPEQAQCFLVESYEHTTAGPASAQSASSRHWSLAV